MSDGRGLGGFILEGGMSMAIAGRCDDWGAAYTVEDSLGGTRVKCVECGDMIDVPEPGPRKRCTVCSKDVSRAARIKDPQGSYYCASCYNGLEATFQAVPAAARDIERMRQEEL